ncbi:MAG: ATP synthase subunit I [Bacteroidetes bacterium]|nr:ATP synthase subunit I [Bacteroidota bacterium]
MIQRKEIDASIRLLRRKTAIMLTVSIATMGIISALLIWKFGNGSFGGSFFLGALLGVLNGIIGFLTIEKFIDRSSLIFLKGIFLGMGIRLLFLLGIFILLVKVLGTHLIALVTGLLIFYFAMTVFEVIFLNKRIALKRTTKELTP